MSNPLVSICIPVRNGSRYLPQAMDSAIAQTYRPLEIIISDDASTDNSLEIVESYRSRTEIPIAVFQHIPSGIGANWNHCIEQATGIYIKFLFQDDLLRSDCIEKMMSVAMLDPAIGLVFSRRRILQAPGNAEHEKWAMTYGSLHTSWGVLGRTNSGRALLKHINLLEEPINKFGEPTATLFQREVFIRVGRFSETYRQGLDYEMYYRMLPYYSVGFVDEELVTLRLHAEQATVVNRSSSALRNEFAQIKQSLFYGELYPFLARPVRLKLLEEFHPCWIPIRMGRKLVRRVKRQLRNS